MPPESSEPIAEVRAMVAAIRPDVLARQRDVADHYQAKARSERTGAAYEWQWKRFGLFAAGERMLPASADLLSRYIGHLAAVERWSVSSISQALAAIAAYHLDAGAPSEHRHPIVLRTFDGIRREHGVRPARATPVMLPTLVALLRACSGNELTMLRNRALLATLWWYALRRSELASARFVDLKFTERGAEIFLPRRKNDQQGHGTFIAAVTRPETEACPVRALGDWLRVSAIKDGALFRTLTWRPGGLAVGPDALCPQTVDAIVKNVAAAAGFPRTQFSAHSMRSGLVTQGREDGVPDGHLMLQTGHQSASSFAIYDRPSDRYRATLGIKPLTR